MRPWRSLAGQTLTQEESLACETSHGVPPLLPVFKKPQQSISVNHHPIFCLRIMSSRTCRGGGRYLRLGGGAPTIDNTVRPYYLCTDGGACVSMHTLGGSWGMLPQKFFKIRCSEIASKAIFVLKFIFGLDAARILNTGPSVVGAPLPMLLVVTCRGYQCQIWALQSIGSS